MDSLTSHLKSLAITGALSCPCKPQRIFAQPAHLAQHQEATGHPSTIPDPSSLTCPCNPTRTFPTLRCLQQHRESAAGHKNQPRITELYNSDSKIKSDYIPPHLRVRTNVPPYTRLLISASSSSNTQISNRSRNSVDPIHAYFSRHPSFNYNPRAAYTVEFARLSRHLGWDDDKRRYENRGRFRDAVGEAFDDDMAGLAGGTGAGGFDGSSPSLEIWQAICEVLSVEPVPDDVKECRKVWIMLLLSS